jgi:hypothetical protein
MYECDHKLVPIVYGYMYGDKLDTLSNNASIYGGIRKESGSPDWFCMTCLEEIYI